MLSIYFEILWDLRVQVELFDDNLDSVTFYISPIGLKIFDYPNHSIMYFLSLIYLILLSDSPLVQFSPCTLLT